MTRPSRSWSGAGAHELAKSYAQLAASLAWSAEQRRLTIAVEQHRRTRPEPIDPLRLLALGGDITVVGDAEEARDPERLAAAGEHYARLAAETAAALEPLVNPPPAPAGEPAPPTREGTVRAQRIEELNRLRAEYEAVREKHRAALAAGDAEEAARCWQAENRLESARHYLLADIGHEDDRQRHLAAAANRRSP
jgi:hypothetical protein